MAKRKRPSLNPKDYGKPTKWLRGFVSQRQAAKFKRTSSLKKYFWGMAANTPARGDSLKQKLSKLPVRVKKKN